MKTSITLGVVMFTSLSAALCVFAPMPQMPNKLDAEQLSMVEKSGTPEKSSGAQKLSATGRLRLLLKPVSVEPEVSLQPPTKPKEPERLKPLPPLTMSMKLIGVVLSAHRSQAVLQGRDQTLHTVFEGQHLPVPHQAMVVEKIEADVVTFRRGERTLQVNVEPKLN